MHRILRNEGLAAVCGYRRHPVFKGGKQHPAAASVLNRKFVATKPDPVWVTDFTYMRTYEGWLYVTVLIDLYSRCVIGWTMKRSPKADLVIDTLLVAVWGRRPAYKMLVHSDQGVQYTSGDWRTFLKDHNLDASMSRRGSCYDDAVAE